MKLILLRHAKSDWDDPLLPDHNRPLNARGRANAEAIGGWLRSRGHVPDLTLCSTATRTQETYAGLGLSGEIELVSAMYLASDDALLRLAQAHPVGTLLMIGHNPGIAALAQRLPNPPPSDPDFQRFSTGACLVLTFDGPPEEARGATLDFTTPRRLAPA